jgi:hypothetical protein
MSHGSVAYKRGCRCEVCVTWRRNYEARYAEQGRQTWRGEALIEDALFLHDAGETPDRIAERLGLKRKSLERAFYRHGVTFPWSQAAPDARASVHEMSTGAA